VREAAMMVQVQVCADERAFVLEAWA